MNQALLIIDTQKELVEGNSDTPSVYHKDTLLSNINTVIHKALEAEASIIFIRDKDVAGGQGAGFDIHPDVNVPDTAEVVDKLATNSFYNTSLMALLKNNKIEHLVIMGCKTEHCVDTAVRTATVSDIDVTLVGDGHSTTDSSVLTAEQIIKHHNDILHGHYNVDHFSLVRLTHEDLFQPTHNEYR